MMGLANCGEGVKGGCDRRVWHKVWQAGVVRVRVKCVVSLPRMGPLLSPVPGDTSPGDRLPQTLSDNTLCSPPPHSSLLSPHQVSYMGHVIGSHDWKGWVT